MALFVYLYNLAIITTHKQSEVLKMEREELEYELDQLMFKLEETKDPRKKADVQAEINIVQDKLNNIED